VLDLPVERDGVLHVYQMYTVKLRGLDRTAFLAELRSKGVGASVHFDPPVHTQPWYAERDEYRNVDLPVTDRVAASIVTLPLYPGMTEEQREYVGSAVVATAHLARA
jgi:dTDP-4-amino-4,6-dideoxygalactose transaminase